MISQKPRKTFRGRKISVRKGSYSKMDPEKEGNQTITYFALSYFCGLSRNVFRTLSQTLMMDFFAHTEIGF